MASCETSNIQLAKMQEFQINGFIDDKWIYKAGLILYLKQFNSNIAEIWPVSLMYDWQRCITQNLSVCVKNMLKLWPFYIKHINLQFRPKYK